MPGVKEQTEGISCDIPTFEKLFESLPEKFQNDEVAEQLQEVYEREKGIMLDRLKDIQHGRAKLGLFNDNTRQALANGRVDDYSKEYDPDSMNFHLQNTSQMDYAFGIAVEERGDGYEVSSHH